ncbi:MAG: hypothetical protein AAFQ98_01805 [Bacteroidota bacterium]
MKAKFMFALGLVSLLALQAYGQEDGAEEATEPSPVDPNTPFEMAECLGLDPSEWRYPEDKSTATEKNAYYSDMMKAEQYQESLQALRWFFTNAPDFKPSIYINGAKIYEALGNAESDEDLKKAYYDSVLWCFDQRIRIWCDEDGKLHDYKAFYNFKFNYRDGQQYPQIYEMYWNVLKLRGVNMENINLVPFMTTVTRLYDPINFVEATDVLRVYDELTKVIEYKAGNGTLSPDKVQEYQGKIDGLLAGSVPMDATFIEENFCAKFSETSDLNLAKKIVAYSLSNKATDNACFVPAAKVVFANDPTDAMARTIADKHLGKQEYDSAVVWYEKAIALMEDNIRKSELYYSIANINRTKGLFSSARSAALKGIEEDPTNNKNFLMIGDLYVSSFATCKKGSNIVHDRAVYIAAYNWYRKVGDNARMASARAQFPSKEEIFQYNMEEGQSYTVGCWVNETVSIMARN